MSTQIQPDSAQRVAKSLAEADRFRLEGNMADAERVCRAALAANPDTPQLLNYLALLLRGRGDLVEAEELFRRAIAAAPREASLYNNLGNLRRARGDLAEAEYSLRVAIDMKPVYPEALYNLGLVLRDLGLARNALESQQRAVAQNPAYADAWVQIGALWRALGNAKEALSALDRALTINSKSFDAHYYRGTVLTDLDRLDDAVAELKTALTIRPDNSQALHALGNTFARAHREDEALEHYAKALDANPAFLEAHRDYNALAWQMGRKDLNLKSYVTARERVGETPDLLLAEADQRLRHEEGEAAEKLLRRAHQTAPERGDITNALARALTMQKSYHEGIALLNGLVKSEPNAVYNHRDLAIALLQTGEAKEAARILEQARELLPHDQLILAHLALAWRETGDSRLDELVDLEKFVGVYDIPPPAGFNDVDAFNRALSEDLLGLHTRRVEPFDQTLRGGTQTPGYLFDRPTRALEGVRDKIREAVADYVRRLPYHPDHPLLGRKGDTFDFATAWSCRLGSSGYHTNHVHPEGWISSAYYAALPEVVSEGSGQQGWLKFGESNIGLGKHDRPGRTVQPGVGKLVLFPSYFWHGTVPFTSDKTRLTIAFDVTPGTAQNRVKPSSY
jgi:tetratricopeptide (TPR) repeat protein